MYVKFGKRLFTTIHTQEHRLQQTTKRRDDHIDCLAQDGSNYSALANVVASTLP